jgi:hypothetical protein
MLGMKAGIAVAAPLNFLIQVVFLFLVLRSLDMHRSNISDCATLA